MIATRWQAWAALGAVVIGMIALLVLGGGDDESRDGVPRRYYQYGAPQSRLMETIARGVLGGPTITRRTVVVDPKGGSGWQAYAPGTDVSIHVELPGAEPPPPPADPPQVRMHVTKTGIGIDSDEVQTDEEAIGLITIHARIDPAVVVTMELDEDVPYDRVIEVMDEVKNAGAEHITLATKP